MNNRPYILLDKMDLAIWKLQAKVSNLQPVIEVHETISITGTNYVETDKNIHLFAFEEAHIF